jgi:DNA repair exonuclease SbcCD nuclease subunit
MGTIKFLTFTDAHISSVNPSSRKGSYEDDIYAKLEQIKIVGAKLGVNFFICGGDLFNLKAPMRNPHDLNSKLITLFKSFPAPVYMTEGNHDLRNDSYETFNEQPLKVLYASDALIQARNIRKTINDITFRIRSIPFEETPDISLIERAKDDVDVSIMILHLYATPDGGMLYKTRLYSYPEIAKLKDDIYVLGHYHPDQGIQIIEEAGCKKQYFINVGAISRGTLAEEDLSRHPKIALVTITKTDGTVSIETSIIRLKVRPVEEAFDVVVHEREKKEQVEAQEFVSKLQTEIGEVPKENRIEEEVVNLNLDKKVLDKVNYFLNEAHLQKRSIEI